MEALKDAPGSQKTARSSFFCLGNSRLLIALLQDAGSTCHIRLVLGDVCLVPEFRGTVLRAAKQTVQAAVKCSE